MWSGWTETRAEGIGELVLNVEGRILTGGLGVEGGIAFQEDGTMCTRPGRGRKIWLGLKQK